MFSSYEVRNERLVTCQLQRRWSVQSNRKPKIKYKYKCQLPGVKKMVGPVNDRLGYRNKTLSSKSVKLMWDICR